MKNMKIIVALTLVAISLFSFCTSAMAVDPWIDYYGDKTYRRTATASTYYLGVERMQRDLNFNYQFDDRDLSWYPLVVDGKYGANTEAAVITFQRDCGIAADGIAGPTTKQYMYSTFH